MGKGKKKLDPSQYATTKVPSKYTPSPQPSPTKEEEEKILATKTEAKVPTKPSTKKDSTKNKDEETPVLTTSKLVKPLSRPEEPSPTAASISLSTDCEDRLVQLVKEWNIPAPGVGVKDSAFELETVYETLLDAGFHVSDVETAMRLYGKKIDLALDWLSVHVPVELLPPRWSSHAPVKVVNNKPEVKPALAKLKKPVAVKLQKRDIVMLDTIAGDESDDDEAPYQLREDPPPEEILKQREIDQLTKTLIAAKNRGDLSEVKRLGEKITEMKGSRRSKKAIKAGEHASTSGLFEKVASVVEQSEYASLSESNIKLEESGITQAQDVIAEPNTHEFAMIDNVLSKLSKEAADEKPLMSAKDMLLEALGEDIDLIRKKEIISTAKEEPARDGKATTVTVSDICEDELAEEPRDWREVQDNDEPLDLSIFDGSEEILTTGRAVSYGLPRFEGSVPKTWSGVTPKSLLASLLSKRGWDEPRYVKKGANFVARVRCGDVIVGEYESGMVCVNDSVGQELAATRALYSLFSKEYSALDIQLPSDFRDVWRDWMKQDAAKEFEASEAHARPRREFVAKLLNERGASSVDSSSQNELSFLKDNKEPLRTMPSRRPQWSLEELKTKLTSAQRMIMSSLPIYQIRQDLIKAHFENDFLVIVGETGSGKTTQVPQFVLEAWTMEKGYIPRIAIAEPRRVSATSVSKRVGEELGSEPGLVSYQIRGESTTSSKTCLAFCTTGVLLRKAQEDPLFMDYDVIIVDEVHERTLDADVLLVLIKTAVKQRRTRGLLPLKAIAMSATMNYDRLAEYLDKCPVLKASGRTFPVKQYFLEDVVEMTGYDYMQDNEEDQDFDDEDDDLTSKKPLKLDPTKRYSKRTLQSLERMDETKVNPSLIESCIEWALKQSGDLGAILVFLPGLRDIQALESRLVNANQSKYLILPLHSSLSNPDQLKKVFDVAPPSKVKIVLSTNIAETGVTIPDVTTVIDTCRVNQVSFNEKRGLVVLTEKFCSRASAEQRSGRAGRVKEGISLRLVTKETFENSMEKHSSPEIGRVPLDQVCLAVLVQEMDPKDFFPLSLDPPSPDSVVKALGRLERLGAISLVDESYQITPLGRLVARLPVDARIGKMVVMGCALSCARDICAVAACASAEKSLFRTSERKRRFERGVADSDVLTETRAFLAWEASPNQSRFAREQFLDYNRLVELKAVRDQLLGCVKTELGIVVPPKSSADDVRVLTAALCAGSHIATYTLDKTTHSRLDAKEHQVVFECSDGLSARLVQSSVAYGAGRGALRLGTDGPRKTRLFAYGGRMKTTKIFLTDLTYVHPIAVALFGDEINVVHRGSKLELDGGWIPVRCLPRTAAVVHLIRMELERVLGDYFKDTRTVGNHARQVLDLVLDLLRNAE